MDSKPEELVIFLIILGLIIQVKIIPFLLKMKLDIISFFTPKVIHILLIFLYIILIFCIFFIYTKLFLMFRHFLGIRKGRKIRLQLVKRDAKEIFDSYEEGLSYQDLGYLYSFLRKIERTISVSEDINYKKNISSLERIIPEIKMLITEKKHEDKISDLMEKEFDLKKKIEDLDHEVYLREMAEKNKTNRILLDLDYINNNVFRRDKLTERQTIALLDNGYFKINEYCIIENKILTFLVHPESNHSKTHTFLVWNVKELLKRIPGIENIREYSSVDADLTFRVGSKYYALEIETGTLLGKKKQTEEKISYLNHKYPGRWFFVLSNQTLISKYRKFGPCTSRKRVREKLQKMIK